MASCSFLELSSTFFMRTSILAQSMSTSLRAWTPLFLGWRRSSFDPWLITIFSMRSLASLSFYCKDAPLAAASRWLRATPVSPWQKPWMRSHISIPWCGQVRMYSWRCSQATRIVSSAYCYKLEIFPRRALVLPDGKNFLRNALAHLSELVHSALLE